MAIQMTRAEYEAKYGTKPPLPSSAPVQMTRAEYEAKYGKAAAPTQPEKKTAGGFLKNVVKSAGRLVKDTVVGTAKAVFQPKKTLEGIGDPLVGAVGKLIPGAAREEQTAAADAVGGFYKDRYGGGKQVLNTLYQDPVGVVSDVAAVLDIATAPTKLGPLSRFAKGAKTVEKASEALNPFQAATKATAKAAKPAAPALERSAVAQYGEVLAPTTKENKFLARQATPKLLEKGVRAGSREGLQATARENIASTGQKLEQAEAAIPPQTPVKTKGVIDALDEYESGFYVNEKGKRIAVEPEKIAATRNLKQIVRQFGNHVSFESMQKVKRVWAQTIAEAKGYQGKTFSEGSKLAVKDVATDAIRSELAKDFPNLDAINKEYSFWKNVDKVVTDTLNRKVGQTTPLSQRIMQGAGVSGGLARGGVEMAVLAGYAAKSALKLFQSTAWRTLSATSKYKLARLLAEGKAAEAAKMINQLLNTASFLGRNSSQQ